MLIKKISLLTAVAALCACGEPATHTAPTQAASVATAPETVAEILVGTDAAYPPYNFRDENGQSIGFDMDILKAIGKTQNLKFQFLPEPATQIIPNLDNKKYKLAISGFVRNAEREQKYQVSNTYAYGQDVLATLSTYANPPETMEDLKQHKTIVLGGTAYVTQVEDVLGKNPANLIKADSGYMVIKGLVTGDANVAFIDKGVVQHYAKSFPNVKINTGGKGSSDFDKYEMVILADKAEAELMQKINAGLVEIVKDGTYSQIYKTWFGEEPKELPPVQ